MSSIFLKTLPFFSLIGCGYLATRYRFFPREAAAMLTRFVFYFALSAMLFRLGATLPFEDIWQPEFLLAYLIASILLYLLAFALALVRKQTTQVAAFEAQTSVVGNTGFLALPMLVSLFGIKAAAPVMMTLAVDLIILGALVIIVVEFGRGDKSGVVAIGLAARGLLKNPMFVSVICGLAWSRIGIPWPEALDEFTAILGAAATPCALFAIGCSLAVGSAERNFGIALWLSTIKLIAHPLLVAFFMFRVFEIETFTASIAVTAAAMPVAGNIYILAQHYNIAVHRVSASILISTALSVITITVFLALLGL